MNVKQDVWVVLTLQSVFLILAVKLLVRSFSFYKAKPTKTLPNWIKHCKWITVYSLTVMLLC